MSELLDKQFEFTRLFSKLLVWLHENGYEVTVGEAYRTKEQAEWDAEHGTGIKNSLHCDRLAMDLNLFWEGDYLTQTMDYRKAGEYWESIGGSWGGRFGDANHFSIAYGGRK